MTDDKLIQLPTIDPIILTDVVRQDQRSPRFEITTWSVRRLSDKGMTNPDGLWFLSGEGRDEESSRSWSLALKIFQRPEQETLPSDLWYWKRELLLAQSSLLDHLPGPIKAPRFYRAEETATGALLWQEYVEPRSLGTTWGLAEYTFAAYQLGCWNGACATSTPLPTESWLTRQHYLSWYTEANPEQDFQFALNQQYITGTLRASYDRLWAERARFYRTLELLPQTFSHFDSQRRNLFIRQGSNTQDELVLIDWAFCGLGPLGAELYGLVSMSATLLDWPPNEVAHLDTAVFVHYLRGLHEAGWRGDADNVRLGYVAWVATWFGVVLPNAFALWCAPEFRQRAVHAFGLAEEDLYLQWLPILSYALNCADEAQLLMEKLHLP